MSDYGGRLIRATEPTVSTTTASGIWTIEEALKYKQAGTWPVQVTADPNFKQTVLLLHGDGTNGAQNNTFLDSSTNNFTITRNGNTTQGTFSPFSLAAGEWSNYFDGTGDYLTVARNSAFFPVANEDFTFEAWVYLTATPGATGFSIIAAGEYGALSDFFFFIDSSRRLTFYLTTGAITCANTGTLVLLNTWTHVAVSRSGTSSNNLKVFVNGVGQSFTTNNTTVGNGNYNLSIGADQNGDESNFTGYISNVRIVKGTGLYISDFTPSTTPLTAITNTSLLTCQSNRFVDNSTNAFAITRNGDVRVTPFSPFAPTAEYDAGTNGGSGYFDGAGDYLSVANNAVFQVGSGDFSMEGWFYVNTDTIQQLFGTVYSGTSNYLLLQINRNAAGSNVFGFIQGGINDSTGFLTSSIAVFNRYDWNHVVLCRTGTTLSIFVNGSRVATMTSSTSTNPTSAFQIGENTAFTRPFNGYISNVRFIKGSQPYDATQTTITVPTAPLTAITNTSLLLNFTNAGIFDNTGKNNLETVGNAQIDTTTKKYGTGSLEFDGTGDYLLAPADQRNIEFLTGDFTIECWIRFAVVGNSQIVTGLTAANTIYWQYFSSQLAFGQNNVANISATNWSPATNTWYHIAITRSGTTVRQFVDGVQLGSNVTSSASFANGPIQIGSGAAGSLNGFIDDLRITKGVARYTANFTPPAAAFQDK